MSDDSSAQAAPQQSFRDLALSEPVLAALDAVGYESPSPIQAATIPHLLAGQDVLGQAQTGTGKTAAFALPILSQIDTSKRLPQALVLAPTRELAIQVAEAFQKYAAKLPGFNVLPIYGGQSYGPQLSALKRGVHVVVGTPGRVLDHMKRGTLDLSQLKCLVLDEADEMLRMGFIEDVEFVLKETPPERQVALFSATMPSQIRRIAQTYLKSPAEVTIKSKTSTATNIRQRYWLVSGVHKLDALTRILEAEEFDGMIVFARTKAGTQELADKLEARGYAAAALNGDMDQKVRERTVARLKSGDLDIVVATDIAARGLDVERVSHVFNYDIPTDSESYVHRIGRTGRAGRSGEAILFIAPRERHMLKVIERATRQPITPMELPTVAAVNDRRIDKFKQRIADTLAAGGLELFRELVETCERDLNVPAIEIAAALAQLAQGDTPLLLAGADAMPKPRGYTVEPPQNVAPRSASAPAPRPTPLEPRPSFAATAMREGPVAARPFPERKPPKVPRPFVQDEAGQPAAQLFEPLPAATELPAIVSRESRVPRDTHRDEAPVRAPRAPREREDAPRPPRETQMPMESFRVEVGLTHGVKPGNLVGAITGETGVDSSFIGRIEILDDHSLIQLPEGMPKEIFKTLQKVWVSGQQLKISRVGGAPVKTPYERKARPAGDSPRPAPRPTLHADRPRPGPGSGPGSRTGAEGKPSFRAGPKPGGKPFKPFKPRGPAS